MIAVVLAGGYAKRLWPLTLNKPKVLLPLAGKPVLNYVIEGILKLSPPVRKIIVSTNMRFQPYFIEWLKSTEYEGVELIPDYSTSEENKLGALKALHNILSRIKEDSLVLAGDSVFTDDLNGLIQLFNEKDAPVIALYKAKDLEETKRSSLATLGDDGRIIEFVEKPANPKTNLIGACIYALPVKTAKSLKTYLDLGLSRDEPGRFIEWLHRIETVYGYLFRDYVWDIGTPESYTEAENYFKQLHELKVK